MWIYYTHSIPSLGFSQCTVQAVQARLAAQQRAWGVRLRLRVMIGNIRPFSPTLRCLSWNVDHWTVKVGCRGEAWGDVAAAAAFFSPPVQKKKKKKRRETWWIEPDLQINNAGWHQRSASVSPLWPQHGPPAAPRGDPFHLKAVPRYKVH